MKKIKLTIIVFFILSFTNFVKADLNISLKKYLDGKINAREYKINSNKILNS